MLPFAPVKCSRLLDVGCAEGAFGETLKRTRGIEVWGVEPTQSAAAIATAQLDEVIEGVFGPEINLPPRTSNCIFFNDVLEHMLDPESALRYARGLLTPEGVVVASIPNIRSFPTIW
jgi:2-polyprenyl-3-methyl-5-hydroxy-6-metoxy-1,4-benzoquinol methylase